MLERLTALQDVLLRAAKGATHPELMAFLQSEIIRCRQALGYPVNEASLSGEEEATSSPSAPARVDGPVGCVVVVRWETGTGRPLRYAVALDPTAGLRVGELVYRAPAVEADVRLDFSGNFSERPL